MAKKKQITINSPAGSMTIDYERDGQVDGWWFTDLIGSWSGFTDKTRPRNTSDAVEYHLTYEMGGIPAVEALIDKKQKEEEAWLAQRELRYMMASVAPRDSELYQTHFNQSHPSYKWGW